MADERLGAIVTGASRGIGKAAAIALATRGFDVVITARTVRRTDQTFHPGVDGALPGSLEETADEITAAGGRAHLVEMDLLDMDRVSAAAHEAVASLATVDVLVNNAIFTGTGNDQRFLDAELDNIENRVQGNVTAQLRFSQPVVRAMVEQGSGVVLNVTSAAGYLRPFAMPGHGGWGIGYAASKGGFHRIAPQLAYEYGADGVIALNVQPGFVATERVKLSSRSAASSNAAAKGIEPAVIGATIAHIALHAGDHPVRDTVQLQEVARTLGLIETP